MFGLSQTLNIAKFTLKMAKSTLEVAKSARDFHRMKLKVPTNIENIWGRPKKTRFTVMQKTKCYCSPGGPQHLQSDRTCPGLGPGRGGPRPAGPGFARSARSWPGRSRAGLGSARAGPGQTGPPSIFFYRNGCHKLIFFYRNGVQNYQFLQ